jgi:hypothetical protein
MGLYKSKNITQAKKTAFKWFGKYIRLRDADQEGNITCCTCGKIVPYNEGVSDCSHWIEASILTTAFNEYNAHASCKRCNLSDNGMAAFHGEYIRLQHGDDIYQELLAIATEKLTLSKEEFMRFARIFKEMHDELFNAKFK